MLEWVPILFFHFTSSFSTFVNIGFLFQSLSILLMLGLHCCEWAFSAAVLGLLSAVASLVLEHRL